MAQQIKDWRAVSEKQSKVCLNPEGDLGGEGESAGGESGGGEWPCIA